MKAIKFKWVIGAAIIMFLFAGTAWADGKRGRDHQGGGHKYHDGHKKQHDRDIDRQHHGGRDRHRPGYHHGRRDHHPNHYRPGHHRQYRHARRHHDYNHPRPRHHRYHRYPAPRPNDRHHHSGYRLSFAIADPNFLLGVSTGGYW